MVRIPTVMEVRSATALMLGLPGFVLLGVPVKERVTEQGALAKSGVGRVSAV